MRDRLGDYPYEVKKEAGKTVLRFYPKSPDAKNPDSIVFVLPLGKEDKKKLLQLVS
jgi:hypothetical protein